MKTYTVAILGATGAVGREMLNILEERQFPVENLIPLASGRSAGQAIAFRGETLRVEEAQPDAFRGVDLVLGAADNDTALAMAPAILDAGALFVDNSSAFRMDPTVPLVVPEVNGNDAFQNRGIVANPNCSTIIAVTAIAALNRLSPVRSMIASTYQAVSGAGGGRHCRIGGAGKSAIYRRKAGVPGLPLSDCLQPDSPNWPRGEPGLHQ